MTTILISMFRERGSDIRPVQRIIRLDTIAANERLMEFDELKGVASLNRSMMNLMDRARISGVTASAPDFSSARFSASEEKGMLILSISLKSSIRRRSQSLKIYGNGAAELQTERNRYTFTYSKPEIKALLRSAVSHGLIEYDRTSVHSRQLIKYRGGHWSSSADDPEFSVEIFLDDYSRADYNCHPCELSVRMDNPRRAAETFPEISEIRALADLQKHLLAKLDHEERGVQ